MDIYLACSNYNDYQAEWVKRAIEALEQNPTIGNIYNPWANQYKDVDIDDTTGMFGSFEWQVKTYQNDRNGMGTADLGVFLMDVDEQDEGCNMELGFMTANHKPAVVVFLSHGDSLDKEIHINLMVAQSATYFIKQDIEELADYNFNMMKSNTIEDLGENFKII
ncbi:nucleoside 2-deoxyribosyltransferase [Aerococcus vaginalis]